MLAFAARTLIVLLVVEGAFSFLELALVLRERAVSPLAERSHTRHDAELGWVNVPDTSLPDFYAPGASLHIEAHGFRGREDVSDRVPEGRARVICSGDSFTLGYGVDDTETWCHRLRELDTRIEPVNMGQGGYGIDQAWLWWRRDGAPLEHHAHVFAFIAEDFGRMGVDRFFGYGKPRLRLDGERIEIDNVPVPKHGFRWPWLTHNSHLLETLRSVAVGRRLLGGRSRTSRPKAGVSLDLVMAVFERLAESHRAAGRELVLVWLPMQEEHAGAHTDGFRAEIESATAGAGIRFIDLVPALRRLSASDVQGLFIAPGEIDFPAAAGHYTALGNRRVAEWIYARVGARLTRGLRAAR